MLIIQQKEYAAKWGNRDEVCVCVVYSIIFSSVFDQSWNKEKAQKLSEKVIEVPH